MDEGKGETSNMDSNEDSNMDSDNEIDETVATNGFTTIAAANVTRSFAISPMSYHPDVSALSRVFPELHCRETCRRLAALPRHPRIFTPTRGACRREPRRSGQRGAGALKSRSG